MARLGRRTAASHRACVLGRLARPVLAVARNVIYLGQDEQHNSPLLLLLRTKKRVIARDVKFLNGSFAHMKAYVDGDEALEAVLDGSANHQTPSASDSSNASDAHTERSEAQPERLQAQGELERPSDSDDGARSDSMDPDDGESGSDPDEWEVEKILQRRVIRGGAAQYRVRWAGYSSDDDTWEPEANVRDCTAMDEFLRANPQAGQLRRSPRSNAGGDSASDAESTVAASDDAAELANSAQVGMDDDDESIGGARLEIVMAALRALQVSDERPDDVEVVHSAVSAGIAALEARTPNTLEEAMASPDAAQWRAARQKEYDSCVALGVWKEVPRASLPKGTNILPCKDVFKIKIDEVGEITGFKNRFTPKGFRQKKRIDYKDTFARTAMYKTERVSLSLAAHHDSELVQFDVPTAFLNADVEEEIYMEMPRGFGEPDHVCRLLKSLYGLKQAPRNWDKLIHGFITNNMGWKATVSDPSLYYRRSRTGRLMLIYRFVDDMQGQYRREDAAEFGESSSMLRERFNIKQMATASWMLGMRITRDRRARTIKLDQELYVTKALERFGLAQCKVAPSPELPGAATDTTAGLDAPTDRQLYMEKVGTLMYAAISTRPDIAHAVHYLASHMQAPTLRDMIAADRVLRYLAGTKDVGLVFGSRSDTVGDSRGHAQLQLDVCAYADADWANNKGDRKSISGWIAKLNGDPVSWSSKKQRVVALSTCEAELYAEAAAIQEVLWLRGLLSELGLHARTGSTVFGDNQSTIAVSKNGVKGERTKHVDVKYHFITETVESGEVKLQWVPTTQQHADIFTKALSAPVFLRLRAELLTR